MSKIFRRVFILNFIISLIGLLLYSQLTLMPFEKEFFYLAIVLLLSSIIISFLVSKIIVLPIYMNLKNNQEEFEKSNNDMKNITHQKSFELELVNTALQEKYKEQKELAETLQEKLTLETLNREKKEQLLIHQSRLAGIGKISINMLNESEELISSLNFILQNINTIHKQIDFKNELVTKSMEQLHRVVDEMNMKNKELKNFINPNEVKKEFYLDEIVMESLGVLEKTFMNHNIKIDYNFSKSISLFGFPTEFSQVIFNILQNAKDALIEKNITPKKVFVSIKKDNEFAYVFIVDNAGGISQNVIDSIFEPYFTTKSHRKASGLGLFISKIIIEENMQGNLEFENASEGAKFIIKIPLKDEEK
ncbi:MAG: HAMP domain-containing sensor histidine kinase [Aliarcobacter sp.]|nr:HAMP domain-containing sensor histidine kinase [Aliarcobacter sp.]